MAANRFAGVNQVYPKIGEQDTPCMLITPDNIAKRIADLATRLRVLYHTTFAIKHMREVDYNRFVDEALEDANQELIPLLRNAVQAGQVFIFSVSSSQYIQPYDITNFDRTGLIVEIRAGTKRSIALSAVCSDFEVRDDILACRNLLDEWGWRYVRPKNRDALMIVIGKSTGLMAVKVTEAGYNQWNEIVKAHDLPITFTMITPEGDYYYLYRYRDIIYLGSGDFPGINLLYVDTDLIPAPCSEDFDIAEGLGDDDKPIIADMPDWLYNTFRMNAAYKRYNTHTVEQLRDMAKRYNLPSTGSKEDLIQRLADRETMDMLATLARRTFT